MIRQHYPFIFSCTPKKNRSGPPYLIPGNPRSPIKKSQVWAFSCWPPTLGRCGAVRAPRHFLCL